jgi:hypothetical protein
MRLKIVIGILALSCALTVAAAAQIPEVKVVQLNDADGTVPVEINARIADDALGPKLYVSVRNNTDKDMVAVIVTVSFNKYVSDSGAAAGGSSTHLVMNNLIHPDLATIIGYSPFTSKAGGESTFTPHPIEPVQGGAAIKVITLNLDFAYFADRSTFGPNKWGKMFVIDAHEGAAKYRAWLVARPGVLDSKASVEDVLSQHDFPAEIGLQSGERSGANHYRRLLLYASKDKGVDLRPYLSK